MQEYSSTPISSASAAPVAYQMNALKPFAGGRIPHADIEKFVTDVNTVIAQYNASENEAEKRSCLCKIQGCIKTINHLYPMFIRESPEYHRVRSSLFTEIQEQSSLMRIDGNPVSLLSDILGNISPEKADELGAIMIRHGQELVVLGKKLSELYSEDDNRLEAQMFRTFISTHEITYLGGGNSQTFRIRNMDEGSLSILRLEGQTATPKNIEDYLRDQLGERFAPIDAERSVLCSLGSLKQGRTLIASTYYPQGNFFDYAQAHSGDPYKLRDAVQLFEQMASIMRDIQEAGCFFPDAKGGNWLVDDTHQLRLLDAKSFLYASNGKYDPAIPGNLQGNPRDYVQTYPYIPPEYMPSPGKLLEEIRDVDKVHAYILGKNIEMYLEAANIPEKNSLFFQQLVFDLTCSSKSRISVDEAMKRLFLYNHPEFQASWNKLPAKEVAHHIFLYNHPECERPFKMLNQLKFGYDKKMEDFIQTKKLEIQGATPAQKERILQELNRVVEQLNDPFIIEIQTKIAKLRKTKEFFNGGYLAKAMLIENAMAELPVEQRQGLFVAENKAVLSALAAQTSLFNRGKTFYTPAGDIDEQKAGDEFKDIKKRFVVQKEQYQNKEATETKEVSKKTPSVLGKL